MTRHLWEKRDDGKWEVLGGASIGGTITEAIALARGGTEAEVVFEFNGVTVRVCADSAPDLIYRDWNRALCKYIEGPVGPYPAATLTADELASDAWIEAEREGRRQAQQEAWAKDAAEKTRHTKERLALAGPMRFSDESKWAATVAANNDDGYGTCIVRYAECWARLMQLDIANGCTLSDIAEKTSHEADTEDITGFMYGAAVSILAVCWERGEELRRWYNLKTQIGAEGEKANESGGVLNPALLTLSAK